MGDGAPLSEAEIRALIADELGPVRVLIRQLQGPGPGVAARAHRVNATGLLASGATTQIPFEVADFGRGEIWDAASPTMFVAPYDGVYLFAAGVAWNSSGVGSRNLRLRAASTSAILSELEMPSAGAAVFTQLTAVAVYAVMAGDSFFAETSQSSGGGLSIVPESTVSATFGALAFVCP